MNVEHLFGAVIGGLFGSALVLAALYVSRIRTFEMRWLGTALYGGAVLLIGAWIGLPQ